MIDQSKTGTSLSILQARRLHVILDLPDEPSPDDVAVSTLVRRRDGRPYTADGLDTLFDRLKRELVKAGIHALDGEIGHIEDLFVEDADWSIHNLLVDTKNWWPGKKVLISPRSAQTIDWQHKLLNPTVNRQKVKDSPGYDASTTIDRPYERHFHRYYGRVRPSHPL